MSHSIELANGRMLDYENPNPDVMDIATIAEHLSNINRYTGALGQYSVAEHSVKCARWAFSKQLHPVVILGCLMHDCHEAFVGDINTPLQRYLGQAFLAEFQMLTNRLDYLILNKYDLPIDLFTRDAVREIDRDMLTVETWHGMQSMGESVHWHLSDVSDAAKEAFKPDWWDAPNAKRNFIACFNSFYVDRHHA
jgi:hypothetical protein